MQCKRKQTNAITGFLYSGTDLNDDEATDSGLGDGAALGCSLIILSDNVAWDAHEPHFTSPLAVLHGGGCAQCHCYINVFLNHQWVLRTLGVGTLSTQLPLL